MEKIICLFESCELCIKLSTKMVAPCLKKQKEIISLIFLSFDEYSKSRSVLM